MADHLWILHALQAGTWCLDQKQACEKDLACQNAYTMATAAGEPPRDGGDRGETLGKLVECVMDTANCLVSWAAIGSVETLSVDSATLR
jgi:hypothetical protein